MNTLYDELSKYFDFSLLPQIESGDCLVGCDVFQLQIVEEDGNTQFSLRWMNENFRRIETKLCGGCKTIELNGKLKELVEKLVRGKKVETVVVVEKRRKGVLFHRLVNGEFRWFGNGDEEKDGKYVGDIENGEPIGQGTFTWSDGEKYVGEWKDGRKSGQGTLTLSSGNKYVGEFKDGIYHGQGTFTWSDGDKYVGEFKDGKKHGQGTYTFSDEKKYVGEWKNGKQNGQGTLTYTDGRNGVGEWRENKPWNITEYNKNGNITGKYVNGLKVEKRRKVVLFEREVDGVLGWYENGDEREDTKFVGEIKNGKQNGEGTQTYPDGRKYVGEWKNGEYHGQGTFTSPDGKKYDGEWKDGTYHGHGTYTFGKGKWEGDKYIGEYKNGKKDGQGTYTFSDGRKYVGEFREGTFWNITEYDKNGNIIGNYVSGVKQ